MEKVFSKKKKKKTSSQPRIEKKGFLFFFQASGHLRCPVSEVLRKTYLFTPQLLDQMGIGYKLVLQQPGELFVIDFMTIHFGVKLGFSQ